jgi:hypothetical protein
MQSHDLAALRVNLHDIDFPAARDVLVRAAVLGRLHPATVIAVSKLEDREFASSFDVMTAIEAADAELQAKIDAHRAAEREREQQGADTDTDTDALTPH